MRKKHYFEQNIWNNTSGLKPIGFEFSDLSDLIHKIEKNFAISATDVFSRSDSKTLMINHLKDNTFVVLGEVTNFDLTRRLPHFKAIYEQNKRNFKLFLPTKKKISDLINEYMKSEKTNSLLNPSRCYRITINICKYVEETFKMERLTVIDKDYIRTIFFKLPYNELDIKFFVISFNKSDGTIVNFETTNDIRQRMQP